MTRTYRGPKFWQAMRDQLDQHQHGLCPACGRPYTLDRAHAHHRKARSHGGPDTAANLVLLHPECHQWAHQHPAQAKAAGLIVPPWADPETVPIHPPTPRARRSNPETL